MNDALDQLTPHPRAATAKSRALYLGGGGESDLGEEEEMMASLAGRLDDVMQGQPSDGGAADGDGAGSSGEGRGGGGGGGGEGRRGGGEGAARAGRSAGIENGSNQTQDEESRERVELTEHGGEQLGLGCICASQQASQSESPPRPHTPPAADADERAALGTASLLSIRFAPVQDVFARGCHAALCRGVEGWGWLRARTQADRHVLSRTRLSRTRARAAHSRARTRVLVHT